MNTKTYWTSSSVLLRETSIDGFLTNIEPIRIGGGREPPLGATVDLAVLRIRYGSHSLPYIPGSSIKGVFRSYATTITRTAGKKVCTGLSGETCVDLKEVDDPKFGKKRLGDLMELNIRYENSLKAMENFWENACLICKIFGSPGYKSKVYFEDAYPLDEQDRILTVRTGVKTGIAIDRRTGAAMSHALYTVEYVEPGANFRFNIRCINLPNYALGLIGLVLRMIHNGQVKVGGFKSRGFGRLKVENLRIMSRDLPFANLSMKSLEDVDSEVDVQDLIRTENEWLVAQGDNAWKLLERLEGVWNSWLLKGSK
ncbi:MAG: type III CRISPR-associated RAMP protein Csx7 [Thermoproteota archaeon]